MEAVSAWVLSALLGFLVLALIIYLIRADAAVSRPGLGD
jgi:hypothetical protein